MTIDKIAVMNKEFKKEFSKVPYNNRIVYISHCIKKKLQAKIKQEAEKLGYAVLVVGGGSQVKKTIQNYKAAVGVACKDELEDFERIKEKLGCPVQTVQLTKEGCKNTEDNLQDVYKTLNLYNHQIH